MPIYEYRCESCGHEFEKLVKMRAEPPPCPECGEGVKKKVSASGFILKGGGWYKDHYGLKSSPKSSDSKSSDSKSSDSKGSGSDSASTSTTSSSDSSGASSSSSTSSSTSSD